VRILAIRGCNLASLAGEFEIDLSRGPIGAAGVFAIVGPTGAGKSTLLDAMCVALFDRTPRLTNRSTVVVGREDDPAAIGGQDVRSLLRRGASHGWAEVDFESGDTRRYRARWSVRRARGTIDGRFQNQQVTLTALDSTGTRAGEAIGGTKTETLEAIHQRLGLSFDQFRRSALLAQGEFATFLRAEGKDRSELLERMTGTEIYSKLSVAAHVKAALAEQQLRERQGAALAIAVLSDEERAKAESDLVLAKHAQVASRARFTAADAAARWLAEEEQRSAALVEAEAARAEIERALDTAMADRAELALRRRAETLRSPWDEATRLDRQLTLVRGEAAMAASAADEAARGHALLAAVRDQLVALHAPVREARIAAGLVEVAAPKKPTRVGVRAAVDDGRAVLDVPALIGRAHAAVNDATWLVARRDLAPAIGAWRELDAQLAQHGALAGEITACDKLLDDKSRHRAQHVAQRARATQEHQQALAKLTEAQTEAAAFQQKRGLSPDAARRAEDDARRHVTEIEKLVAIAADARGAAAARADVERQLGELETMATADAVQRTTIELDRDRAVTLRNERSRMLDELRKAAGHAHARTELVDGDPCPLCGALEHPWKDRGAFDSLIGSAQTSLDEATGLTEAAVAALANLAARQAQRDAEHARLTAARSSTAAIADGARSAWHAQLSSLGVLLLVEDPSTPAAQDLADERLAAARHTLEAARATRGQVDAAMKAAAEAQARVQARQADVEHHVSALRELDAAIASVDAAAERLRGERAGKVERLRELLSALDAAFARWHGALSATDTARPVLGAARDALARETLAHAVVGRDSTLTDDLTEAGGADATNVAGAAAIAAKLDRRKRSRTGSAPPSTHVSSYAILDVHTSTLLERCRGALAELAAAWSMRADAIAGLDAELSAATLQSEAAVREAERLVAEAIARRDAKHARRDAAIAELADAAATLDAARVAAGFDADELYRLLSDSPARTEQLAERLESLDRAADRATTLIGERRRLVDAHSESSPFVRHVASAQSSTATSDSTAAENLRADAARVPDLEAAVATADHHAAAIAATLAADGDARARRESALAQFAEAEHAAEIDRVLGEVIGSHDGKLFRSFAQSLTLDGLLAVANSHLEELAPRYQLERVPKHDLELQVIDRDLGNEIRSVQSLSGGESFLVSLALALGLSSMSAHDVRVRTLLIDEGFGTLDPATLDSALAVLDALQATGRQVGVISHVPALVERVGAHIRVHPRGGGRSEVVVAEA